MLATFLPYLCAVLLAAIGLHLLSTGNRSTAMFVAGCSAVTMLYALTVQLSIGA